MEEIWKASKAEWERYKNKCWDYKSKRESLDAFIQMFTPLQEEIHQTNPEYNAFLLNGKLEEQDTSHCVVKAYYSPPYGYVTYTITEISFQDDDLLRPEVVKERYDTMKEQIGEWFARYYQKIGAKQAEEDDFAKAVEHIPTNETGYSQQ